jgi:general secretion pathway protein D
MFVPQRTDARLIVPELDKLLNAADAPTRGLVRLIAMEKLNGILAITGNQQYLEDVRRWVEILDREGDSAAPRVFVYRVQNGRARDLAKTLGNAFGTGGDSQNSQSDPFASQQNGDAVPPPNPRAPVDRNANGMRDGVAGQGQGQGQGGLAGPQVRISADEVNNAIVVYGTPKDYAVVEEALRKLDVTPTQVLIEAAITEVTLNDTLRYGVQWNFQTGDANFALSEGNTAIPTRLLPGFSFFYGSGSISATLNALESKTNIKVVSAPKILVLNNQTAALQVGNQVPILTQSAVGVVNPDSPIVNSVSYRDTGVILRITPRVNASGLVLIDISQEVSGISDTQASGIDSPTFTTRRVASTIAAQDGQVLAIGGLFSDSKTFTKAGLPILARIPVLGGLLFGRTNNTGDRTELVILIKPTVLRTADDGRAVTEELRAKLRTLEPFKTEGRIP